MNDTLKQTHVVRDSLFGIVLPLVCLVYDPVFFRDGLADGDVLLGSVQVFAYLVIGLCMLTLTLWLCLRIHSPILLSVIAGIFSIGTCLSLVLGSLLSIVSGLGAILLFGGFISHTAELVQLPLFLLGVAGTGLFITPSVYLRHARIATHRARTQIGTLVFAGVIGVSLVLVLGVSAVFQTATSDLMTHLIDTIVSGEETDMQRAVTRLHTVRIWCPSCTGRLVRRYMSERNPAHCARLADVYHTVTGVTIDDKLPINSDGGYFCEDYHMHRGLQ